MANPAGIRKAVVAEPPAPATAPESRRRQRPIGVAVLSILSLVSGALFVLAAIVALLIGVLLGQAAEADRPTPKSSVSSLGVALFAIFFLAFAIPSFLIGWGFWGARPWSWTLFLILTLVSVPINLAGPLISLLGDPSLGEFLFQAFATLFSLAFSAFCLWYLYLPGVRAYFGKSHMRAPWQRSAPAA